MLIDDKSLLIAEILGAFWCRSRALSCNCFSLFLSDEDKRRKFFSCSFLPFFALFLSSEDLTFFQFYTFSWKQCRRKLEKRKGKKIDFFALQQKTKMADIFTSFKKTKDSSLRVHFLFNFFSLCLKLRVRTFITLCCESLRDGSPKIYFATPKTHLFFSSLLFHNFSFAFFLFFHFFCFEFIFLNC